MIIIAKRLINLYLEPEQMDFILEESKKKNKKIAHIIRSYIPSQKKNYENITDELKIIDLDDYIPITNLESALNKYSDEKDVAEFSKKICEELGLTVANCSPPL